MTEVSSKVVRCQLHLCTWSSLDWNIMMEEDVASTLRCVGRILTSSTLQSPKFQKTSTHFTPLKKLWLSTIQTFGHYKTLQNDHSISCQQFQVKTMAVSYWNNVWLTLSAWETTWVVQLGLQTSRHFAVEKKSNLELQCLFGRFISTS